MPSFTTEATTPAAPERILAFVADTSTWSLFPGAGPVPGIVEAVADRPFGVGTRVRVTNTDGSVHHEVVTVFGPDRYALTMELAAPLKWLVARIDEELRFHPAEGGTRIVRRFDVRPRNLLTAPIVWVLVWFLRRAVVAHDAAVARALA